MSPTIELALVRINLISDLPLLGFSVVCCQARVLTSHLGGPISGLERHIQEQQQTRCADYFEHNYNFF